MDIRIFLNRITNQLDIGNITHFMTNICEYRLPRYLLKVDYKLPKLGSNKKVLSPT